jgi:hypothetical protein
MVLYFNSQYTQYNTHKRDILRFQTSLINLENYFLFKLLLLALNFISFSIFTIRDNKFHFSKLQAFKPYLNEYKCEKRKITSHVCCSFLFLNNHELGDKQNNCSNQRIFLS